MAEATSDHVCERVGSDGKFRTVEESLFGHGQPGRIDELVVEFGADNPADADVIGSP